MVTVKERISEEKNAQITPISAITKRLEKYESYTNLPFIEKLPFILELMLDNEFKQNIQKIYLFGSYAYGEPNEDSDIDFCVIIDDTISAYRNDVYFKIEKKLLSKHMVPNDLLVYNAGTFDKFKYDRGIERVVVTYGVLIYERK
jgi:predicted nucleotidyltransferase